MIVSCHAGNIYLSTFTRRLHLTQQDLISSRVTSEQKESIILLLNFSSIPILTYLKLILFWRGVRISPYVSSIYLYLCHLMEYFLLVNFRNHRNNQSALQCLADYCGSTADGRQLQESAEIRSESAERNFYRICKIRMMFDRYASGFIKPLQKIYTLLCKAVCYILATSSAYVQVPNVKNDLVAR